MTDGRKSLQQSIRDWGARATRADWSHSSPALSSTHSHTPAAPGTERKGDWAAPTPAAYHRCFVNAPTCASAAGAAPFGVRCRSLV